MTPLVISADDYAYSEDVDRGILQLIERGRLTATSCLVMNDRWVESAKKITPAITAKADIGLHLDFTEFGLPLRHPLPLLMLMAFARRLPEDKIRKNIAAQLDRFDQACSRAPDYVDGHQHVHQLPQIRDVLIDELTKRYSGKLPWLRISSPPKQDGFKGKVIRSLGAAKFAHAATNQGFVCSHNLLGVYDFNARNILYIQRLDHWLRQAKSLQGRSVLMCHPAWTENAAKEVNDPIYPSRLKEFSTLASTEFQALLEKHQVSLVRGSTAV